MSVRVLFVCLGNICRSPVAEAVFRAQVEAAGLDLQIEIDSAGTGDWHVGCEPDRRAGAAAIERGYDTSALRARQVEAGDFTRFDYVVAMDAENLRNLRDLAPPNFAGELKLLRDFCEHHGTREVPDPYYGGEDGFHNVLDLVEEGAAGLLQHIRTRLNA